MILVLKDHLKLVWLAVSTGELTAPAIALRLFVLLFV
jgi:hypothetical protein